MVQKDKRVGVKRVKLTVGGKYSTINALDLTTPMTKEKGAAMMAAELEIGLTFGQIINPEAVKLFDSIKVRLHS